MEKLVVFPTIDVGKRASLVLWRTQAVSRGWGLLGAALSGRAGNQCHLYGAISPVDPVVWGSRLGRLWKCWHETIWARHPQTLGSWFSSVTMCLFARSYLLIHLFLNLMEASTWEGLLFQESAAKRKTVLVLVVTGEICLVLSSWHFRFFKEILFCISWLWEMCIS